MAHVAQETGESKQEIELPTSCIRGSARKRGSISGKTQPHPCPCLPTRTPGVMRSGSGFAVPHCWRCWNSSRLWHCPHHCSSRSCPCSSQGTTRSAQHPAPTLERSTSQWQCWPTEHKVRRLPQDVGLPQNSERRNLGRPLTDTPNHPRWPGSPPLWSLLHMAESTQSRRSCPLLHQGVSKHHGACQQGDRKNVSVPHHGRKCQKQHSRMKMGWGN